MALMTTKLAVFFGRHRDLCQLKFWPKLILPTRFNDETLAVNLLPVSTSWICELSPHHWDLRLQTFVWKLGCASWILWARNLPKCTAAHPLYAVLSKKQRTQNVLDEGLFYWVYGQLDGNSMLLLRGKKAEFCPFYSGWSFVNSPDYPLNKMWLVR